MTEIGNNLTDHLLAVWRQVTDEEEWVLRRVGSVTLQKSGMVPTEGGIRVRDAVEAFLRYTDKSMVASADAVVQGLSQACKDRLIGIGRGTSMEKLQSKRCGEYVALDRSEEGVWIIPSFTEKTPDPLPVKDGTGSRDSIVAEQNDSLGESSAAGTDDVAAAIKSPKTVQSVRLNGDVPLESWTEVFRCFVGPAARLGLKSLQLGIAFKFVAHDDQPLDPESPTLRAMREAARQLGIEVVEDGSS